MTEDVPKHEMPISTYEQLPDTVLDYKKKHGIGRFDPAAFDKQEQKLKDMWKEVEDEGRSMSMINGFSVTRTMHVLMGVTGIKVDSRCCLVNEPTRRGTVRFIGTIPSLPGMHDAPWIGIALDEPYGKNDGSVNGERYFQCEKNHGVIVRPERMEIGDFPELGLDEEDPDMEEI